MTISALIHTGNSEKTIAQALTSVKFADEIVVVDMESTDNTIAICKEFNAQIYSFKNVGYVEPARNFGISKATKEWVLIVDADEEVPATLAKKLKVIASESNADVVKVPRKNLIWGTWMRHAGWWPDYNIRFFKKGAVSWPEVIHSQPDTSGSLIALPANEDLALIHHNYDSIASYLERLNKYTSITAGTTSAKRSSALRAFTGEFIRRYFATEGYKDGFIGLSASLLQAVYEFVVVAKHAEQRQFAKTSNEIKELRHFQQELAYWLADYEYKKTDNAFNRMYWAVRRRLRV